MATAESSSDDEDHCKPHECKDIRSIRDKGNEVAGSCGLVGIEVATCRVSHDARKQGGSQKLFISLFQTLAEDEAVSTSPKFGASLFPYYCIKLRSGCELKAPQKHHLSGTGTKLTYESSRPARLVSGAIFATTISHRLSRATRRGLPQ